MNEKTKEKGKKESIHDGHRDRMRDRFLTEGIDHFQPHEVLEVLLYYCISRRNTNRIAHELLKHFGSLSQVMEAPPEKLKEIDGIGDNAAFYLNFIGAFERYYHVKKFSDKPILATVKECVDYLRPQFLGRKNETVFLLCLDSKCKVLSCRAVSEGSVNFAGVPVRRIVERALADNASSVILAHNHPSGLAFPSHEDVQTTRRVATALDAVDIILTDHVIIADDDAVSLAQSRLYSYEDCRLML